MVTLLIHVTPVLATYAIHATVELAEVITLQEALGTRKPRRDREEDVSSTPLPFVIYRPYLFLLTALQLCTRKGL